MNLLFLKHLRGMIGHYISSLSNKVILEKSKKKKQRVKYIIIFILFKRFPNEQ